MRVSPTAERDYESSSDGEAEEDGAQAGGDGRASSGAQASIEDDSIHSFEGHAGEMFKSPCCSL